MVKASDCVVVLLDDLRYAFRLSIVDRVIRAVEVTPLPKAPAAVLGVISLGGGIVPIFNLRRRFHLPERGIRPSDHFVIATIENASGGRRIGVVVDSAVGVIDLPAESVVASDAVTAGIGYVEGIARLDDGLLLIHDLNTFLSREEQISLDAALNEEKP